MIDYYIFTGRTKPIFPMVTCVILFLLLFNLSFSQGNCVTKIGELPSIAFKSNSVKLLPDAEKILASVAFQLKNNPGCKAVVTGYCSSNKKDQQRSWDKVNRVINYLIEKEGISSDRFIFRYGEEGDCNMVDLRAASAGEEGPNIVPPPHPNYRKN